ncbi:hypothetical protein JRQ81_006816 [Phrynocephalus forsythii]|uniref:Dual oxidase maturation factor 2 n=1 Tax=Phrynocephalus forsythii TaxID=171643 RepID=A0A9Q0XE58_9SAUR|nr:hypothetical protein JRQ81_006816 [Phrynocephalus forsythii]
MTLFNGIYPFYPQSRKPFVFNVNLITIIVFFLVLAVSFLLILPGIRGRARLFWLFRVIISLFIGGVTVAVNFTADWEQAQVRTNTSYKSFSTALVDVDIGLNVGLSGVNITLVGRPMEQLNETINYNEYFPWWIGMEYDQQYDEGLQRGLPRPILYVAEKFSAYSPCDLNSFYRLAGHYASVTLWVAFCAWLVANMLFSMPVPVYGGYMILITGAFLIFALLSFSTARNAAACLIQFGGASLRPVYGASFWLTLATGLLCFLIGGAVIALHYASPSLLKAFFDLCEDEEEEEALSEIYVNPHFSQPHPVASPSNFRLSVQNS